MPQAARRDDRQKCPMKESFGTVVASGVCIPEYKAGTVAVEHVGGPIVSGSPNVNINGKRAARCGDRTYCEGTATGGFLVTGAEKIKINGQLAAMVGSFNNHLAPVTQGSPDVIYGSEMAGATFGDAASGTKACREAAQGRKPYREAEQKALKAKAEQGEPEALTEDERNKLDQRQGKSNNCGQETARQLCIERCAKEGPGSKACEACKLDEDAWYRKYVEDPNIRTKHKKSQENLVDQIRRSNDEKWATIRDNDRVFDEKWNPLKTKDLGETWEPHQGKTFRPERNSKPIIIEQLPPDIDRDPKEVIEAGNVGSTPSTRDHMLREWCGIEGARIKAQGNSAHGIGEELARGNTVVASVDVNELNQWGGPGAPHAVTVTQIEYDASGRMKEVTINDTSKENGCGRTIEGARFEKSLMRETDSTWRPTNVVPGR